MVLFSFSTNNAQKSIYDVEINDIIGDPIDLYEFKGKHILFVNVASECGFTKQYSGLEQLHRQFRDNLIVIGLPCNQFGGQEPGSEKEILQFCEKNFDVSFLLTEKIEVKGDKQHPLYSWLTNKRLNGKLNSTIKWNFQKYIVDGEGELLNYFFSSTQPMSAKITSLVKQ